ncbi:hypothetical protein CDAR_550131 [Caerostris darwini]|uniref:Uncharacterized protein n=1 Tax=Caerostris darwini TaxID=1538125 RepID=A0AAV4PHQ1_9ARAC|nr:hypothetical protein CDAR_550131 [Caerostris darwini]
MRNCERYAAQERIMFTRKHSTSLKKLRTLTEKVFCRWDFPQCPSLIPAKSVLLMRCASRRTIGEIGFPLKKPPPIKRRLPGVRGRSVAPLKKSASGRDGARRGFLAVMGGCRMFLGKENSRLEENSVPESD